jgi:large subunit ribosomal protein L18e
MKATGPSNPQVRALIKVLKRNKTPLYQQVAQIIEEPRRSHSIINVDQLSRLVQPNETIIIPGKVLGMGIIDKKITVAALNFSQSAKAKIEAAGGKILSIDTLETNNPRGSGIRIIIGARAR